MNKNITVIRPDGVQGGGIGIMNGPANSYAVQPSILEFFKFTGAAAVLVSCYILAACL